jgi:transcription elongation factor Elf1
MACEERARMTKLTIGERFPCPLCETPSYSRTPKKYKAHRTHYLECRKCGNSYNVKEEDLRSTMSPSYYGPTPQMDRLVLLWVGDAIGRSLGQ